MKAVAVTTLCVILALFALYAASLSQSETPGDPEVIPVPTENASGSTSVPVDAHAQPASDYWSMVFVFVLASFIGMGVIARVSRLLHTPLMSLTNAISAIAVVGSIIVTGSDYPIEYRILGAIALFASMTNIVSGFLITERMLKMFKQSRGEDHT